MANPFSYPAWDLVAAEPIDTLPYTGVSFGAPINQPGSWKGQVSLSALSSAALAAARTAGTGPQFSYMRATQTATTALFVELAGDLIWGGIVWVSDYDSSDPMKQLKVSAAEFGSYFQQRVQALDYTSTWAAGEDPMIVAQQICEDALAKGSVMGGITLVLDPAGGEGGPKITPSYPGTSLQTVDSIVSTLSQMGYGAGFDYSFRAAYAPGTTIPAITMTFHYPRQGRTAQESQLVILSRDCIGFTYPIDGTQRAGSVTETGSGAGTLTPARASVDLPGVPLLDRTFSRPQINDERTLANIALGDLGLYCYGAFAPTFTLPVTTPDPVSGLVPASAVLALGSFERGDDFLFRVDPVSGGGENVDPRFPLGCEFVWRINQWQCNVADQGVSTLVITGGIPPLSTIPPPQPPL